jgi:DNA helicase HerA-like ATPase
MGLRKRGLMKNNYLRVARGSHRKVLRLLPSMANRHGLVTGATGTGKTVTLQVMAEEFSRLGVPVFMADVKGDLSGLAQKGELTPTIQKRIEKLGLPAFTPEAFPVTFFDIYGVEGHPARTTVEEMGPLLMSRILNLNATQQGVMSIIFQVAKDNSFPMVSIENLQFALRFCGANNDTFQMKYGRATQASLGTIQRSLLLFGEDITTLFGEPQFDIRDLIRTDVSGRGFINILSADKLILQPRTYSTFLLWLLTELFKVMPEVGDIEKPRLAFFFDEAHLLFLDIPQVLLEKIEQVVRLVRSKGIGIYFVTQNPLDIPEVVLSQLSNRVQHALRAFTPKDARAVRLCAETFRANVGVDVATAITELGVGEALVSFLDKDGHPTPVERAYILPPRSKIGAADEDIRKSIIKDSILLRKYKEVAIVQAPVVEEAKEEFLIREDHGGLALGFLWDKFMAGFRPRNLNLKRRR